MDLSINLKIEIIVEFCESGKCKHEFSTSTGVLGI